MCKIRGEAPSSQIFHLLIGRCSANRGAKMGLNHSPSYPVTFVWKRVSISSKSSFDLILSHCGFTVLDWGLFRISAETAEGWGYLTPAPPTELKSAKQFLTGWKPNLTSRGGTWCWIMSKCKSSTCFYMAFLLPRPKPWNSVKQTGISEVPFEGGVPSLLFYLRTLSCNPMEILGENRSHCDQVLKHDPKPRKNRSNLDQLKNTPWILSVSSPSAQEISNLLSGKILEIIPASRTSKLVAVLDVATYETIHVLWGSWKDFQKEYSFTKLDGQFDNL